MNDPFLVGSLELTVLPEHIDRYGHLNNGNYPYYYELARDALQTQLGLPDQAIIERGFKFIILTTTYNFKAQLYAGNVITIKSQFSHERGPRVKLVQDLYFEGTLVGNRDTDLAFLSPGKVERSPPEWFVKAIRKTN